MTKSRIVILAFIVAGVILCFFAMRLGS